MLAHLKSLTACLGICVPHHPWQTRTAVLTVIEQWSLLSRCSEVQQLSSTGAFQQLFHGFVQVAVGINGDAAVGVTSTSSIHWRWTHHLLQPLCQAVRALNSLSWYWLLMPMGWSWKPACPPVQSSLRSSPYGAHDTLLLLLIVYRNNSILLKRVDCCQAYEQALHLGNVQCPPPTRQRAEGFIIVW